MVLRVASLNTVTPLTCSYVTVVNSYTNVCKLFTSYKLYSMNLQAKEDGCRERCTDSSQCARGLQCVHGLCSAPCARTL